MSDHSDADGDVGTEADATAGGFEEFVPEPLLPVWRRVEAVQEFRETYGDTYTGALEALTALALIGGYVYWLFLFFTG